VFTEREDSGGRKGSTERGKIHLEWEKKEANTRYSLDKIAGLVEGKLRTCPKWKKERK